MRRCLNVLRILNDWGQIAIICMKIFILFSKEEFSKQILNYHFPDKLVLPG